MRQQKREYSIEERKKILDYIIENEGFYNLRGNAFWKEMEKRKVLKRTWQSMKEHFRMKIVNNMKLYNISKENERKIISGYNNTKSAERTDIPITPEPEDTNIDFSDEDKSSQKNNSLSISSDDSDNLADGNKPSTSNKGFKKQLIDRKSKRNVLTVSEEFIKNNTVKKVSENKISQHQQEVICSKDIEQNDPIDVASSSSISDANSDNAPSCNVSSTNLDETCTEFSVAEDKKFLKAITKYDLYIQDCACILTFIKQYTDYYKICDNWTDLYDRFIEIINNLQLYDFLAPKTVLKLQKMKEPLEKFRSAGFQEPQYEILHIKLGQETLKVTVTPNPDYIYLNQEQLDLVTFFIKHKNIIYNLTEKISTGELSKKSVADAITRIDEFTEKYSSIINNQNTNELIQVVKEEVINDCPIIHIKQENLSMNDTNLINEITTEIIDTDIQSNISETIPVQPKISTNLPEIQNNCAESSEYLESLTTEDLHVTNILGEIIENNLNESDLDFLTCETHV